METLNRTYRGYRLVVTDAQASIYYGSDCVEQVHGRDVEGHVFEAMATIDGWMEADNGR